MSLGAQAKVVYQFCHKDNILVELLTLRTSEDKLFVASIFVAPEHLQPASKSTTFRNVESEQNHV